MAQNAKHSFLAITRALAQLVQVGGPGGFAGLLDRCPRCQTPLQGPPDAQLDRVHACRGGVEALRSGSQEVSQVIYVDS